MWGWGHASCRALCMIAVRPSMPDVLHVRAWTSPSMLPLTSRACALDGTECIMRR